MKKLLLFLMAVAFVPIHLWAQTVDFESITPEQIPAGTKVIPKYAFQNRIDLVEVTIPEGVEVIEEDAFYGCSNLAKVTLPSTLIQATNAFPYCNNLKDVTCFSFTPPFIGSAPTYRRKDQFGYYTSSPRYTYYENLYNRKEFSQDYGLYRYNTNKDQTVRETEYPYDQVVYLTYMMRGHTLRYPSYSDYTLSEGWNHFPAFDRLDLPMPTELRICNNYTMYNNPLTNKPNMTMAVSIDNENKIYYAGHLSVSGDETISLGTFNMEQDAWENAIRILKANTMTTTTFDNCWPTLYTEAPMRADAVKTTLRLSDETYRSGKWIFMSLPFDCRLSDLRILETGNNFQWAIRKYSGQMRADAKFDEVWVKQTTDSILHANEGFIFTCGWNEVVSPTITIELPAINNAKKNRIFTTEDVSIPLQQYTASAECDRSWNFIGNPYPCFYSTKYFEPSMPFVVYGRQEPYSYPLPWGSKVDVWPEGYCTYSPIDDNYVLHPFQGFFVQRPLGYDALNLPEYGRFATVGDYEDFYAGLTSDIDYSKAKQRRVAALRPPVGTMENRRVINLRLKTTDGFELDRTRLVGNPDASIQYDPACDATKFPDHIGNATLLYLIGEDLTHYAISEQPFVDGDEVSIGAKFPVAGEYTMQADFKTAYPELEGTLMLVDYETGHIQSATEPYTFTAQAGETTTRFALTYGEPTAIHEIRESYVPLSEGQEDVYYDLQGRPVTGILRPGIYIKNGKKIIIK
jgi:hypothetical protein